MSEITLAIISDKVQIHATKNQSISALHRKPAGTPLEGREKTLVIMAHGFPGHRAANNDLYGDLEFLLSDKGFHTLRFDFRGCGDSDGSSEEFTIGAACEDFQSVVHWAKNNKYRELIYIGEGLGAAISIMNVSMRVNSLILLWPVLDCETYAKAFGKVDKKVKDRGFLEHDGTRLGTAFLHELEKIDIVYAMQNVRVPTLIMHGAMDKMIPVEQLDLARANIRSERIEITTFHDGAEGLQKMNHRKMMFYHISQFIEKYA